MFNCLCGKKKTRQPKIKRKKVHDYHTNIDNEKTNLIFLGIEDAGMSLKSMSNT